MDTQPYQCDLLSLCPFTVQAAQVTWHYVAFSLAGRRVSTLLELQTTRAPGSGSWVVTVGLELYFRVRQLPLPLPQMIFSHVD